MQRRSSDTDVEKRLWGKVHLSHDYNKEFTPVGGSFLSSVMFVKKLNMLSTLE